MDYYTALQRHLDRGNVDAAAEMIAEHQYRPSSRGDTRYQTRRQITREPDPENPLRMREKRKYTRRRT